jgi:hypothetical protein
MTIVPADVSDVTRALERLLSDDIAIGQAGVRIERSEEICRTATAHGWVGIYPDEQSFPERAIGMGAGFRYQIIRPFMIVQESDPTSGAECEDRLSRLVQKVVGRVLSDSSLGGTVAKLNEVTVRRVSFDKEDGVYMQFARIDLTGEMPVSAQ